MCDRQSHFEQQICKYDGFNRLVKTEMIKAGTRTAVEYAYDGDGLRVEKTVKRSDKGNTAEATSYLYDRQHVILETKGNDEIRYIRGNNYIARIDNTDKLSYFLFNGHGDVVQTVSEAGVIENQYDYDIFGNPTLTVENYLNSIRYAGEFYDTETGLYYLRARYYDPYIGRFISEDSYWGEDTNPLSLNLYTYAHNDPIQFIDPTGHSAYDKGQQQVKDQVKNESEKGLKNKLNAQKSAYESAVKKGNKEEADLYKGRIDALNDIMSGSDKKSGGSSKGSNKRDSSKVTVTWEGYIIDIDISEYNEYKSHGWGVFYGEAYADKMYNSSEQLHSITTSSGRSVVIENRGNIGRIETGEGSRTNITNYGEIGIIITGAGSDNEVINYGDISSLRTGKGNHTRVFDDKYEYINEDEQEGSIDKFYINTKGTDNPMSEEQFEKLVQSIIDYGKELTQNRPYINDPRNWEGELQNNIKPLIDMIPSNLSDKVRTSVVNAIIISEAQKLQSKYKTVYIASDNFISKYITERGLHQNLTQLYEQYPFPDNETNPLAEAFMEGFTTGLNVGVWYAATTSNIKGRLDGAQAMLKTESANAWGTLADGTNQGIKHFVNYWDVYPERIPSIANRLGVDPSDFSNTVTGFENFTKAAQNVIANPNQVRTIGEKTVYFVEGAENVNKGVTVIVQGGKVQSMMPTALKDFLKLK